MVTVELETYLGLNMHSNPDIRCIGYSLLLSLAPCSVYSSPLLVLWVPTARVLGCTPWHVRSVPVLKLRQRS